MVRTELRWTGCRGEYDLGMPPTSPEEDQDGDHEEEEYNKSHSNACNCFSCNTCCVGGRGCLCGLQSEDGGLVMVTCHSHVSRDPSVGESDDGGCNLHIGECMRCLRKRCTIGSSMVRGVRCTESKGRRAGIHGSSSLRVRLGRARRRYASITGPCRAILGR